MYFIIKLCYAIILCNKILGQPNCAEDTDDFSLTWPLTAADRNTTLPCSGGIGGYKIDKNSEKKGHI